MYVIFSKTNASFQISSRTETLSIFKHSFQTQLLKLFVLNNWAITNGGHKKSSAFNTFSTLILELTHLLNCSCNVHSGITNKRVVYAVLISITSVYMIICYCLSRKPFRLLIMLNDKLSNCSSWRCHTGILFVMLYRVLINETSREVFVCKWNLIFNVLRAILNFVIYK